MLVLTCSLSFAACGSEKTYTSLETEKMNECIELSNEALALASTFTPSDFAGFNKEEVSVIFYNLMYKYFENPTEAKLGAFDGLITTYNQMVKDMGSITETGEATAEINGDNVVVVIPVKGENCDGQITFKFSNDTFYRFIEGDAVANTSFKQKLSAAGDNMSTAGLNTLLGMGTVFLMLILISFIISSFKLFSNTGKKKKEAPKAEAPAPVVEAVAEDLTDDTELVAVIMAAISAYEGNASTDGFVVRSIKKANRRI